jgi:hypothetical protein
MASLIKAGDRADGDSAQATHRDAGGSPVKETT